MSTHVWSVVYLLSKFHENSSNNFLNYSANKQTEVKTLPLPSCGVGNKNVHVRDTGKGLIHIETHLCRYTLKIENDNIDNN